MQMYYSLYISVSHENYVRVDTDGSWLSWKGTNEVCLHPLALSFFQKFSCTIQ